MGVPGAAEFLRIYLLQLTARELFQLTREIQGILDQGGGARKSRSTPQLQLRPRTGVMPLPITLTFDGSF